VTLKIEKAHQCVRFRYSQVVAGEDAKFPTTLQKVSKVFKHAIHTTLEGEAHDNVDPVCGRELRNDVREERVIAAGHQIALRVSVPPEFG
jgi:hypothetical protein